MPEGKVVNVLEERQFWFCLGLVFFFFFNYYYLGII